MFRSHDPGPCPVDDMPHTTCTSADYQGRSDRSVVVVQSMPATSITIPAPAATETTPESEPAPRQSFTTAEYRGRRRKVQTETPR